MAPRSTSAIPRERLAAVLILTVALGLGALGMGWGLPGLDSWSNDDPSPRVPLRIGSIWLTDTHKYPYLQLGLDRLLYAPYLSWLDARGGIRSDCERRPLEDCFTDEARAATGLMRLSRLRSLLMFLGLVLAVGWLSERLLADRRAALWAALWTALTAEMAFFGKLGNLDLPYTFWFALSLVPYLGILDHGRRRDYLGFGFTAALAITTKDQVIGAYVLPGLRILALHARRSAAGGGPFGLRLRRFLDARLLGLVAVLATTFALVNDLVFNPRGFLAHVDYYIHGEGAMVNPGFSLGAELAQLLSFGKAVVHAMGLPLALLAAAGLAGLAVARWTRARWLLLPLASYYLFMMLPVVYTDTRFSLPALVLLYPGAGWLAARLWNPPALAADAPATAGTSGAVGAAGSGRRRGGRTIVLAVAVYSLLYSLNVGLAMRGDTRYAAEAFIRRNIPPGEPVVAMDESRYLPRLETMGLTQLSVVDWRDLDDPEEQADALADIDAARWIVLSDKAAAKQTGEAGALRDRLLGGSAGFVVAWEGRSAAPMDAWLPGAWVEARVSPRVWVLRRIDGSP